MAKNKKNDALVGDKEWKLNTLHESCSNEIAQDLLLLKISHQELISL